MKKILRSADEQALGGGSKASQWRRRQRDPEYAKIWFDLNGRPACFADERDAYWEKQRNRGYQPEPPAKALQERQRKKGGVDS